MPVPLQAIHTKPADAGNNQPSLPHGRPASRVYVELRTRAALRLVTGRAAADGKPAIIGLFGFAVRLRDIWDAARQGDPYARWWLLKVEAACRSARARIRVERLSVHKTLKAWESIGIDTSAADALRRIELMFACPYAYWGARLVKQLDQLITELDAAAHIGARRKTETRKTRIGCERALRHTFSAAQGFRSFGLTREAIENRERAAVDAEQTLGRLPGTVLSGEQWPALLHKDTVAVPIRSAGDVPEIQT